MPEQVQQPPVHPIHSGQPFAIVSGEQPRFQPEVQGGHKGLEQLLAQGGFQYEQTHGNYGGGASKSPVFVLYNAPRDAVMELGRKMGQESVVYSENGQHELIYVNGKNVGRYHPPATGGMEVHPSAPKDGLSTQIPGVGHVRLNFDSTKLVEVPKKGSAMNTEDTQKSEVSVAEFKQKLAQALRSKITSLSKSLEDLAVREVERNTDAVVGDFKKSRATLTVDSPDSFWIEELSKSEEDLVKSTTMDMAAAMKRVYDSYHQNVAVPQFPNDPQKAHELALAAAKDWASRATPEGASRMAVDSPQHNASAPAAEYPDSFGPGPVAKSAIPQSRPAVNPTADSKAQAIEQHFFNNTKPTPTAPPAVPKQPMRQARLPAFGTAYRKEEMPVAKAALCEKCGKSMCKGCDGLGKAVVPASGPPTRQVADLMGKIAQAKQAHAETQPKTKVGATSAISGLQQAPIAPLSRVTSPAPRAGLFRSEACLLCGLHGEGCQCMVDLKKNSAWLTELSKSDEWLGKNVTASSYPSKTARRRQNLQDIKYAERKGDKAAAQKVVQTQQKITEKQKLTAKSDDSERIAGVRAREGAEISQIPFRDPNKGPRPETPDHVLSIAEEREKAKKSEDFIDMKNANNDKRIKNVGAETPKPAEPTKEVKGKLDEGSGGEKTKGKLGKTIMAPEEAGTPEMVKANAGPPMAKPPSGKAPTPSKPPTSKPKLPKMGKAAIPQTRMEAGNVQAASIRAGHESAPSSAPTTAPKAVAKPSSDYSDFMPAGKFSGAGSSATPAVGPKVPAAVKPASKPAVAPMAGLQRLKG